MNCKIFEFRRILPYDSLDHLLCRSYSTFYFTSCARGECPDGNCHGYAMLDLLQHGIGCHAFDPNTIDSEVAFKYVEAYSAQLRRS